MLLAGNWYVDASEGNGISICDFVRWNISLIMCSLGPSSLWRLRRSVGWIPLRNRRGRWSVGSSFGGAIWPCNTWSPVADMVICRKYAGICLFCSINTYFYIKWLIYFAKGVVTHGGLLYVVGGDDLTTEDLNSMEVYNPTTNTWLMHPIPMGIGRSFAGIALIDSPF